MQSVTSQFDSQSRGLTGLRSLKDSQRVFISFLKTFTSGTTFFTIGSSLIGGPDIIKGVGSVIQEWDKYDYVDYSDRLLRMEWTRELDLPLGSMISAMADITLANTDDKFTPGSDPVIGAYMLPKRPIKLSTGFLGETIPIFGGLTESAPKIDKVAQTADFHCIDNLQTIYNYPLQQSVMYQNYRIDQIISALLIQAGLTAPQFVLDTSIMVVPFAFFNKDDKVGDIIKKLAQAEGGTMFQDENGIFRYWNREHLTTNTTPVATFTNDNCYSIEAPDVANVINVVEITSNVRAVQALQKIWQSAQSTKLPAGGTLDVFADFSDDFGALPVTSVDTPVYISSSTSSNYTTNTASDGSGDPAASAVTVTATSLFATAYKMTFQNNAAYDVYLTDISLYGTPAKVTQQIYVRKQDDTSVAKYDEQVLEIKNDFIQSDDWANSYAQIILTNRALPSGVRDIVFPGRPELQLGDLVNLDDGSGNQTFYVYKITGTISSDGFNMAARLLKTTIDTYFKIGISTIGGSDKIAP